MGGQALKKEKNYPDKIGQIRRLHWSDGIPTVILGSVRYNLVDNVYLSIDVYFGQNISIILNFFELFYETIFILILYYYYITNP